MQIIAARVRALGPDAFVIAGDVADTTAAVEATLSEFTNVAPACFYLPGNHDVFVEGDPCHARNSQEKYEKLLPRAAAAAGFRYLGLEPHRLGDVAFVGTLGWYDYTLRDPRLDVVVDRRTYRQGLWRHTRAFDHGNAFWPRHPGERRTNVQPASTGGDWCDDEAVCDRMLSQLGSQLDAVASAGAVVAAVHVVPFAAVVERGFFGDVAFHDAYLGSARFGERLQQATNLRVVITGHLHRPAQHQEGTFQVVRRPLGDVRKHKMEAAERLAERAVGLVEC